MNETTKKVFSWIAGGDEKEMKYLKGRYSAAVILNDGEHFVLIEKPEIETRFCFGHGQDGITTEEEMDQAQNNVHIARTSEQFFIRENMREIDRFVNMLEYACMTAEKQAKYLESLPETDMRKYDYPGAKIWIIAGEYRAESNYGKKCSLRFSLQNDIRLGDGQTARIATPGECFQLLSAEMEVRAEFQKRLKMYLKRFGLSKIRSWSYLVD